MHDCMRKAQYSLVEKYKNNNESEATAFGGAIHKALEHWYCLPAEQRELTKAQADKASSIQGDYEKVQQGALESIRQFVIAAEPVRWLGDEDKRSVSNGIKILKAYFKHYLNDGLSVVVDANGPVVERRLEAPLYEDENTIIILHGTIDALMLDQVSGQQMVCDHKTTSVLGTQFYNRIKPNHQYTGYLWLAQQCGLTTSNLFLVNGIQVAKTKTEFARQQTDRTENDFAEFKQTIIYTVKQFLSCHETGIYPMYAPNPCSNYGACAYLDVCSAPATMRESILKNSYTKEA